MEIEKNHILKRHSQKPISIDNFYSKDFKNQGIIIFCHGYKGFKDWGAWDNMSKSIAESGTCVVKFNFSHNGGTMTQPIDFPDLEAFGNNNYSLELDDLSDVIDWVEDHFKDNPYIDCSNISLIGHSRGGGIVLLKTAEDKRIKKVISLAGVSDFAIRFGSDSEIETWKKNGVKYVINGRTKQNMPHFFQFYEDFLKHQERLDIRNAVENCQIPHLIIHGDKDTSVKVNEAYALHDWNPNSQLEVIKNADHVFNTKHPWNETGLTPELKDVVSKIITFLK